MKKLSVSIGIPAFNEEQNIESLLKDIFSQNLKTVKLEEIIVASDGSTDNTIKILRNMKKKQIKVFAHKNRKGVAVRQNGIMQYAKSDILVILNADVRLVDKNFLEKITSPVKKGKADLVAANIVEANASTFVEKVLQVSMNFKHELFSSINDGNNVYTCFGVARAFSKNLYKNLKFTASVGEDAYSYFYTIFNGYTYQFSKQANVYYKLPDTFKDHEKQSLRFLESRKKYTEQFGKEFIEKEYSIPKIKVIQALFNVVRKAPIFTFLYFGMFGFLKIKSIFSRGISDTWQVSTSSKALKI